jgi:hypothetical protein
MQQQHKGARFNPAAMSEEGETTGNRIRGRSRRQELRLGSMKTLYEALVQTLVSEVGISSGLQEVSDWTLWRGRPSPKRKKRPLTAA